MSEKSVQVFGRRHDEEVLALRRSASKRRQGTKSREVWGRLCRERYGDLIFAPAVMMGAMLGSGDLDGCAQGSLESRKGASRSLRGRYQGAIGSSIGVIVPRKVAAGVEPAHLNGKFATLTGGLAHDVSILLGVGRHLGSQPRAKTSITIMRAPQRGHGRGRC
jgi:hypothetical protein